MIDETKTSISFFSPDYSVRSQKVWISELNWLSPTHSSEQLTHHQKSPCFYNILITSSTNVVRTRIVNSQVWPHHWNLPPMPIIQSLADQVFILDILSRTPSWKQNLIFTWLTRVLHAYTYVHRYWLFKNIKVCNHVLNAFTKFILNAT